MGNRTYGYMGDNLDKHSSTRGDLIVSEESLFAPPVRSLAGLPITQLMRFRLITQHLLQRWRSENLVLKPGVKFSIATWTVMLALWSSVFAQSAPEQMRPDNGDSTPQVVLEKLAPPLYPQMAKIAGIAGEVRLKVYVRVDGSIESVTALSGHPILIQAAVESANRSQFKCQGCNDITERSLSFFFALSTKPPDPCCCTAGHVDSTPATPTVTESEGRIAITAAPLCICPDACASAWAQAHSKFRSLKCLYLWKCGTRHIAIM